VWSVAAPSLVRPPNAEAQGVANIPSVRRIAGQAAIPSLAGQSAPDSRGSHLEPAPTAPSALPRHRDPAIAMPSASPCGLIIRRSTAPMADPKSSRRREDSATVIPIFCIFETSVVPETEADVGAAGTATRRSSHGAPSRRVLAHGVMECLDVRRRCLRRLRRRASSGGSCGWLPGRQITPPGEDVF